MAQWLKQSTAATIVLGPFVDQTDGFTAETALTISQADIRLSKNGGAFAQTNNAAGATHMENGHYSVPLDTTDTNTLGRLKVAVNESGALPVWQEFHIVPANVWDSFFGADKLQVHADEITANLITAAAIATGAIDADAIAADAITAAKIADGAIDAATFAANAITATAIAADAITAAKIADGAIDAATFAAGAIDAAAIAANAIGASELAADAVAEIADAVWDEATTGHTTSGTFGEQCKTDIDDILTDTGTTLDGRIPAALVGGRMDSNMGAISTSATAADNLEAGALGLVSSTCAAGSTTTSIVTNLTEATDDHYNGRVITFTSGALLGQSSSISDYVGATKTLTIVALTEAPANTDAFVIS